MNPTKTAVSLLNPTGPVLIGLAVYTLILSFPLPRQFGLSFRYDLYLLVALMILPGYLVFRLPGFAGRTLAITFTLVLFAMPLSGLWSSGQSEEYIIGGIFPWSDASHYYFDTLGALAGWKYSMFSASRPIFPTVMAAVLALAGQNLPLALAVFNLGPAFSVYLATREVQRTHGTLAGMVFFLLACCYARVYVGMTMSENLGFLLGMLAFALLWRCGAQQSLCGAQQSRIETRSQARAGLAGIFLLTLGLNTRLGAFIALPLIIVWLAWRLRERGWISWKHLALGVCVAAAGFLTNTYVASWMTEPQNRTSYNLAMQVYSLVGGGKDWNALFSENEGLQQQPSRQIMEVALKLSQEHFRSHPTDILKGALYYWRSYFTELGRGGFSYLDGPNDAIRRLLRVVLFALSALGLLLAARRRSKDPLLLLLAAGWVGMFLSIPLVPPTNTFRLRLFAVTQWVEAALPAVSAAWILSIAWQRTARLRQQPLLLKWAERLSRLQPAWLAQPPAASQAGIYFLGAVLVALILVAPPALRAVFRPESVPPVSCPAGQEAVLAHVTPRSYLVLVENDDPRGGWIPFVRRPFFIDRAHNVGNVEITPEFDRLTQPTAFIYALDLIKKERVWVFIPYEKFPFQTGLALACGRYTPEPTWRSDYFFYADSVQMVK